MTAMVLRRPLAGRLSESGPAAAAVPALTLVAAVLVGASAAAGPIVPLVSAVAAVFLLLAWQRPVVAAAVVVGVAPALSGIQRGAAGPLKVSEVAVLLSTAALLLRHRPWGQRLGAADWGLLGFAAAGLGFGLLHTLTGTSSGSSLLRVGLAPTLLYLTFWAASRGVRSVHDLRLVARTALLVGTVPAALAVAQSFDLPGVRALLIRLTGSGLLTEHGAAGLTRATGPFPIWHSLAAYLLVPFALAVTLLLRRDTTVLPRVALLAVSVLDASALVLSLTIAVLAWAVVTVLLVAVLHGRLVDALTALALAFGVAGILFSGPISARITEQSTTTTVAVNDSRTGVVPQTIAYRISVWERDYVPLLERSVPAGVGNELPASAVFQHAENQYILLLLRGGVLLLLAAVVALALVGRRLLAVCREDGTVGSAASAALCVLLFLPVAGMVWPYLSNAGLPQALLSLSGGALGAAARRNAR
jgi:hypothetical protein